HPDRVGLLDHGLALGRQVQAAAAPTGRRIHGEVTERQQPLQVARQGRLLDVEGVANLDGGDAVLLGELGEKRELAGRGAERQKRVVVAPSNKAGELTDARGDAGRGRALGDVADVSRCGRNTGCHNVHWGHPSGRDLPVMYNLWPLNAAIRGGMATAPPAV